LDTRGANGKFASKPFKPIPAVSPGISGFSRGLLDANLGLMHYMCASEDRVMLSTFTAKYTKIPSGYMAQLVDWPEVVTEGKDLEECRAMLADALREMVLAYREEKREIPIGNALLEQIPIEV
jgi:predicted RNase H-like HicB family nuclease